jgi:hypothetical protein
MQRHHHAGLTAVFACRMLLKALSLRRLRTEVPMHPSTNTLIAQSVAVVGVVIIEPPRGGATLRH